MSAKATFWAWEQDLKQGAKLVLLALADSANDAGQCWPGYGEIKRKTGINSDASIARHLAALSDAGLLEVTNRYANIKGEHKRLSNMYKLPVSVTSKNEVMVTSKNEVTMSSKNEVTITSKFEEESNKESNKESKSIYRKLDVSGLPESVTEFIDHRINLKKPLTQPALSRFVTTATNTAAELNLTFDAVVGEIIDAGWQSVKTEWLKNRLRERNENRPGSNSSQNRQSKADSIRTAVFSDNW